MTDLTPEQQRVAERFPHGALQTGPDYGAGFTWLSASVHGPMFAKDYNVPFRSLDSLLADPTFCTEYGREEHER